MTPLTTSCSWSSAVPAKRFSVCKSSTITGGRQAGCSRPEISTEADRRLAEVPGLPAYAGLSSSTSRLGSSSKTLQKSTARARTTCVTASSSTSDKRAPRNACSPSSATFAWR